MSVKNSLTQKNCISWNSEKYNNVFKEFKSAETRYGIKELPIAYFIRNSNMNINELYDRFHDLLESEFIYKQEYTECPYCMNENRLKKYRSLIKCDRCNEMYKSESIIEKFILNENWE